jgi:hypothetical protein
MTIEVIGAARNGTVPTRSGALEALFERLLPA